MHTQSWLPEFGDRDSYSIFLSAIASPNCSLAKFRQALHFFLSFRILIVLSNRFNVIIVND